MVTAVDVVPTFLKEHVFRISSKRQDKISWKRSTVQMLHMRMEWVDEVSVGISLCFHLLVLLISFMLNTLVPFLLKTDNKSASEKTQSQY